ncbi:MAG: PEGA domain-containing protein [Alkalispirochaeta sp.]
MRPGKAFPPKLQTVGVLAVLMVVLSATATARGSAEEEALQERAELRAELTDEEVSYEVAIAAVVAPEADDRQRSTVSSYAEVLRDLATGPPTRYVDDEEREYLAELRIARHRRQLLREIDDRRNTLERRRLERTNPSASTDSSNFADDEQLRRLHHELDLLASFSPSDVVIPREISISIADESPRFRRVLPTAEGLARELPGADLMLYLVVEPVGDRVLVQVRAYDVPARRDRELFRVVDTVEAISPRLESREREVVAAIAGRALGGIKVSVEDDNDQALEGRVFVGERYVGVAPVEERYVPPGTYSVRTELPDGRESTQSVEISAGPPQSVEVIVREESPPPVTIRSVPTGARVYRGSQWVGFTPVEVSRPREDTNYTLVQDGYYDSRVTLGRESPSLVERTMISADGDWAAEVEASRDRFYRSFGVFALSVGVPILINGLYQNYAGLVDEQGRVSSQLSASEQDRVLRRANTLYVGYYAGLGLSAGLFGNMMWRLVNYVQTAQGYHTR